MANFLIGTSNIVDFSRWSRPLYYSVYARCLKSRAHFSDFYLTGSEKLCYTSTP